MPTGSFIPKVSVNATHTPVHLHRLVDLRTRITFYTGHTYIYLNQPQEFYTTMIILWHRRNEYWDPEHGSSHRKHLENPHPKACTGSPSPGR